MHMSLRALGKVVRALIGLSCASAPIAAFSQNAVFLEGPGFEPAGLTGEFYGFAMADSGYNAGRIDPDWFDVVRPTKLPAFDNEFGDDGETYFSVRQTRVGLKWWQPTEREQIRGIFEWELFGVGGDAGQTTFRLRHAYIQYGKFGIGQYHSVFMDMDIFPDSIEYWGPTGMVLFRNLQVRYMPVMGDRHNVAIALERPGASGDAGRLDEQIAPGEIVARFPVPDLSAHYRYSDAWGHAQIAGILRRIEWDDVNTGNANGDLSGGATGWGLNLTTNVRVGPGVFKGGLVYGRGVENYLNDSTADIAVTEDPNNPNQIGGVKKVPVVAASLFYDWRWNDRLTSTIGYSFQDLDYDNTAATPDTFTKGQYALANLIYYPVKQLMTAVELQYGRRENFSDGYDYDLWRVQFSAKYRFNFRLGAQP